ncbi:MAG: M42 family metallopeptidase [Promethearchaeati archaeon SRVP18_Atabeyarchaeia-1]
MSELELSLKKLVEAIGVSGYEENVRETIREMLPDDVEAKVDTIGNLIASIGRAEPHVIFIAHMDELGYLVSNIEDNGFVRLRKVGSLDDRYMPGKILQIHTSKGPVEGVIGLPPPHLTLDPESFKKVLQYHELLLDLGTRSKDETLSLGVRPLDSITLKKELRVINGVFFCCRSIDDRFGCLALIEALKRLNSRRPERKLTFIWSVQEETGLGGAKVIANTIKADKAIAVDSYPSGDAPLTQFHLAPNRLGDGPVLRVVDYGATANPVMVERVKKIAKKHDVPLGAGPTGGYTDGSVLQEKGIPMVPITIPVRYMHSPVEMCHRKDLENLIDLLTFVAAEI